MNCISPEPKNYTIHEVTQMKVLELQEELSSYFLSDINLCG